MKHFFVLLLIFATSALSQNVRVVEQINLTDGITEDYYFPRFSPDDKSVYFTKENYNGLYRLNFGDRKIEEISGDLTSGFEPQFTEDNRFVFYKSDEFINRLRYSSIIMMDLFSKRKTVIVDRSRNVSAPILDENNSISYNVGNENRMMNLSDGKLTEGPSSSSTYAYIKNNNLIVNRNGVENNISPFGDGAYVWASLSASKDKILFTFGSQGSFISDLSGNILVELGYANYPQWSPDGNWIIAMQDYDDGYNFTESEIVLIASDGSSKINLTDTEDTIEMYPRWSHDGKMIVYHTDDGNIHLLKLSYE